MSELQDVLFDILSEFDQICRKHNIIYYLSGGSNLGALRHQGFIPWDDDADVRMSAKEFAKFNKVLDTEMPPGRALSMRQRFPDYGGTVPRYINTTTTALVRNRMADETPKGVFLDIILMDPMPRDPEEQLEWKKLHYIYCELHERYYACATRPSDWDTIDNERYQEYRKLAEQQGLETVLQQLEARLFNIDEEDADEYCSRVGNRWLNINPISWYGKPREVMVEGKLFYIASKAERCARHNYGSDWKYVPVRDDQRTGHVIFHNLSIPARVCEADYLAFASAEEIRQILNKCKEEIVIESALIHKYYTDLLQPAIDFMQLKIKNSVQQYGEDTIRDDLSLLSRVFYEYYQLQKEEKTLANRIYIPLEDHLFDLAMYGLIRSGKFYFAKRVLEIKRDASVGLTHSQEELLKFVNVIDEIDMLIDEGDYENAAAIFDSVGNDALVVPTLQKAHLSIAVHFAKTDKAYLDILEWMDNHDLKYLEEGELLKFRGDALMGLGKIEDAMDLYRQSVEKTRSGFVLLDLRRFGLEKSNKDWWMSDSSNPGADGEDSESDLESEEANGNGDSEGNNNDDESR